MWKGGRNIWHLKIRTWCNIRISTIQSPSIPLKPPCHYFLRPVIDSIIIKKPYHVCLMMNQLNTSTRNQICSNLSNLVPTRTTRTVRNIFCVQTGGKSRIACLCIERHAVNCALASKSGLSKVLWLFSDLKINFSEKTAIQKSVTYYCLLWEVC